jgi:predicted RNase H-like HicB family nuclease
MLRGAVQYALFQSKCVIINSEVSIMNIKVTVIVTKEENWYVAKCLENSVASQGKTIEESLENLKEALELYYEDNIPEDIKTPTFITTLEVAL